MPSSRSPAWIPDRMTLDSIAANGACPSAAHLNCAGCSIWPRCRPRRPKHGSRFSTVTEPRAYPLPQLSSSWLDASPAPPGRCTPTKQNSIPRVSRIPAYEPIDIGRRQSPLVWCGRWCFRLASETVKMPGWRGQCLHLLSLERQTPIESPHHTAKRR